MQIKRDNAIYLEIEQFEDYELTNNISFEMAVRNQAVRECIEGFTTHNRVEAKIELKRYGIKYPFVGLGEQKSLRLSEQQREFLHKFTRSTALKSPMLENKKVRVNGKNVNFISAIDAGKIKNIQVKEGISDKELEDFISRHAKKHRTIENFKEIIKKNTNFPDWIEKLVKASDADNILTYEWLPVVPYIMSKAEANIYATINTKRPQMMVEHTVKMVTSTFNMTLNIEELIAQISIIKKEFDNNINDIKSTAEHFNIELEKAEILICDSKGKCIDPRSTLTKQQKMADMFFIYDAIKAGINEIAIKYQLSDYYHNDNGMDSKTLKKYKEISNKYIDKFGYKELLTGVKTI
jgi:hypothetical protein